MLLAEVVATSAAVAATRSRTAKVAAIAELLRRLGPEEVAPVVGFLTGAARQGRIGIGWATIGSGAAIAADAGAAEPSITVGELDHALTELAALAGPGSAGARRDGVGRLLARATAVEVPFLRALLLGELRQGALDGVMTDAIGKAAGVPTALVRRAAMLTGDLGETGRSALFGGAGALGGARLTLLRPVLPMLAATSPTVTEAFADGEAASVEWKLDGARVQVHRDGDDVAVFTRNGNDVTGRLPRIVEIARSLPATSAVLDGEALGFTEDAAPRAFQDTMSGFGRDAGDAAITAYFFDVLHLDGSDLLDQPLSERLDALRTVADRWRVPGIVTADADTAERFASAAVAAGHEGVMVKALASPYDAGRRGSAWRKVKPVHTLDLVVLAAEWGHGRRRGWLSNLHLGARGSDGTFGMVGKTFKGLTDELLTWQTARLQELAIGEDRWVVHVRPELVVEIALDGAQASTRYPGGVALRFARVRRYRPDKPASEADTIEAVHRLLPGARRGADVADRADGGGR